jgi:hypothetical protein
MPIKQVMPRKKNPLLFPQSNPRKMQKLINIIALLSGLTSLSLIGGSAYVLLNKEALIESAKEKVTKEVTAAVTEALPGMIQGAMPEVPEIPSTTGPVIPSSPF